MDAALLSELLVKHEVTHKVRELTNCLLPAPFVTMILNILGSTVKPFFNLHQFLAEVYANIWADGRRLQTNGNCFVRFSVIGCASA